MLYINILDSTFPLQANILKGHIRRHTSSPVHNQVTATDLSFTVTNTGVDSSNSDSLIKSW